MSRFHSQSQAKSHWLALLECFLIASFLDKTLCGGQSFTVMHATDTPSQRIPDELWCHVIQWVSVKDACSFLQVHPRTSSLKEQLPWYTLVSCNKELWTPHTRRLLLMHATSEETDWTHSRTRALFSALRFHVDGPLPICQTLDSNEDPNQVRADTTTDVRNVHEEMSVVTNRGVCLWNEDTSSFTWVDWANVNQEGHPSTHTFHCPFTADVPWHLSPDTIELLTVWASVPQSPLPEPVRLLSVAGEPEDLVGITNYRHYFRMTKHPETGAYKTQEILLSGEFEADIAQPQCAHYVFPYLVLLGYAVTPPVSSYTVSSKVVGVWNVQTQRPVLHNCLRQHGWYRACTCTAINENGRHLYWIDDYHTMHKCLLDRPYASPKGYPKALPKYVSHVTGLAVSEIKRVTAFYCRSIWTMYDMDNWTPLRTFSLRHASLQLCPWANSVMLVRRIGTKLLTQKVRLGEESFFLSSRESIKLLHRADE